MSRPRLRLGPHLAPGLIAVALFAVLAWVFVGAGFGEPAGFGDGSVTEAIGFALLNITGQGLESEGFMVALIVIALVLDAALDGAVHLARRDEEGGEP